MKQIKENFDDFIVANNEESKVIASMRKRLCDSATRILQEKRLAKAIRENEQLKKLGIAPVKDATIDAETKIIEAEQSKHLLSYILVAPNNKLIGIGISFNHYKLHWGIYIYSKKGMIGWAGKDSIKKFFAGAIECKHLVHEGLTKCRCLEDEDPTKYIFLNYKYLTEYAKKVAVIGDDYYNMLAEPIEANNNDDMLKALIAANNNDEILSIFTVQPTGSQEDDVNNLSKALTEIMIKLGGHDIKSHNMLPQNILFSLPNPAKEYIWQDLCQGYRMSFLAEPPTKIRTFLEIAGIGHREIYISNILAFLLDANEPHPFGNIFFRSLYKIYKKNKYEKTVKDVKECPPSTRVQDVCTEHEAGEGKRIDLLVATDSHVMAIEHKINASLYNPLKIYKDKAEEMAALKDDGVAKEDKKEVLCIVLCPFELSKDGKADAKANEFVHITYKELFNEVTNHFNEVNVYHKDKHFLYMQLFYDLFRTMENLTEETSSQNAFTSFMTNGDQCQRAIQAIHNLADYQVKILEFVNGKVMADKDVAKLHKKKDVGFRTWYGEGDEAWKRGGTNYERINKPYMLPQGLLCETTTHKVDKISRNKLSLDIRFDLDRGLWRLRFSCCDVQDKPEDIGVIADYAKRKNFEALQHGIEEQTDDHYIIWLNPLDSKDKTQELIASLFLDAIKKLEGK